MHEDESSQKGRNPRTNRWEINHKSWTRRVCVWKHVRTHRFLLEMQAGYDALPRPHRLRGLLSTNTEASRDNYSQEFGHLVEFLHQQKYSGIGWPYNSFTRVATQYHPHNACSRLPSSYLLLVDCSQRIPSLHCTVVNPSQGR